MKLATQGLIKIISGIVVMGVLLFVPAGTVAWMNGWILMAALFVPMLAAGIVLLNQSPELLKKRLNNKEQEPEQKAVIVWSALMFIGCFVVSGLDYRFGWSHFPTWATTFAVLLMMFGYILYLQVMKENEFLSRTVEVQENQKVIDTGLYGVVRHPMYFATVIFFLAMPLVLGSFWGFLIMLLYPFLLVKRIKNEEQVLEEGLPGYKEYKEKVKYRILPFIW